MVHQLGKNEVVEEKGERNQEPSAVHVAVSYRRN